MDGISANTVKMHTKVTSSSEKHVKMHTKKSDAHTQAGWGLRPKAYNTKRTLGLSPYREKNPPRPLKHGAVESQRPTTQREPWVMALTGKKHNANTL